MAQACARCRCAALSKTDTVPAAGQDAGNRLRQRFMHRWLLGSASVEQVEGEFELQCDCDRGQPIL